MLAQRLKLTNPFAQEALCSSAFCPSQAPLASNPSLSLCRWKGEVLPAVKLIERGRSRRRISALGGGMWLSRPQRIEPGPGQESVWDYTRPPRLEECKKHIRVEFNGKEIASTRRAYRVLETSHPPVYYLPQEDLQMEHFIRSQGGSSFCEWKGSATYWTVKVGDKEARNVGWSYEAPTESFKPIKGHIAMYAAPMDACYVDGEKVTPQPGNFYGGWVTKDVVGPFKGSPGSMGW